MNGFADAGRRADEGPTEERTLGVVDDPISELHGGPTDTNLESEKTDDDGDGVGVVEPPSMKETGGE